MPMLFSICVLSDTGTITDSRSSVQYVVGLHVAGMLIGGEILAWHVRTMNSVGRESIFTPHNFDIAHPPESAIGVCTLA